MAKAKDPATTAANKKRSQTNLIEWKPGQSGNPNGRPKKGQSWAEIIRELGDMTPLAASDKCISIARARIAHALQSHETRQHTLAL